MASKTSNKKPSGPVKKSSVKALEPKPKAPAKAKTKAVVRKPVAVKTPVVAKKVKAIPAKIAKPKVAAKVIVVAKPVKSAKAAPAKVAPAKAAPAKVIVAVVAARPGKSPPGLSGKVLEQYRDMLLAKRRELLGDVSSMEEEALRNTGQSNLSNLPIHMADMGTDNYEQEFTLGLVEKDRNLLRDINTALAKINAGTYGICEGTNKPIAKPRLDAQPWARFSIEHARSLEQRRMRA